MSARSTRRAAVVAALVTSASAAAAPASASTAMGGQLTLSGSVHGAVTVVRAVCDTHVAAAKHHFFFDIEGISGGRPVLLSGRLTGYSGPGTYRTFSGLLHAGTQYLVGHGSAAGSVAVGAGANSAGVRLTMKEPPGEGGASATVTGHFTCTAYTSV